MKKTMKINMPNNQFDFDEMFTELKNANQSKIVVAEFGGQSIAAVQFCIIKYT